MKKCLAVLILLAASSAVALAGQEAETPSGGTPGVVEKALNGPLGDVEEIVYAVRGPGREWHFYGNFGYKCQTPNNWLYGGGPGSLNRLNIRTGQVTPLLEDRGGSVRDPDVHYSGQKILFSYRRGREQHYHLYEINTDGTGLKQLTFGPWDDMEPIYLPGGEILFCSSRCRRYVPCLNSQVAILYKCDADGSNIRRISANVETENTPAVMPDGRIVYMRWEYVHRGVMAYHHLWTINPDGTGQMVLYGNMQVEGYAGMRENVLMTNPRPIPGTGKIVAIFCDKHGRSEYRGYPVIVDPDEGPDKVENSRRLVNSFPGHPDPGYDIPIEAWRDPYPISEDCFLIASHQGIYVMDGQGRFELLHALPEGTGKNTWIHEPRALRARLPKPVVAPRSDWSQQTATLTLNEVHTGRNMKGVGPGEVKDLLILEVLPTPVHFGPVTGILSGGHNIRRVIGTVPVEQDGSAHFRVPARRALVFIARDEKGHEVKRMNSFVNLMPGEKTGCVGCHERRTMAPPPLDRPMPTAMQQPPDSPQPIVGVPDRIDFNRDIQPILDRHCVRCHNREKEETMPLTGERYLTFSDSYRNLKKPRYVSMGETNMPPYSTGTATSKVIDILENGHNDVKLTERELQTFRMWVTTGGLYVGTYAAMGYDSIKELPMDRAVVERRCYSCHAEDAKDMSKFKWPGGRRDGDLFNITNPDRSELLRRPLAEEAGGLATVPAGGESSRRNHVIVFKSKDDPDYQALRGAVIGCISTLADYGWYGTEDWHPNEHYIREMKRYGVLPEDFDLETDPFDPFAVDQRYFQSIYNDSPYKHHPSGAAAHRRAEGDPSG